MNVTLLSSTIINKSLYDLVRQPDAGDLHTLLRGEAEPADRLAEWAARVCYLSTERMGTAPHFIKQRIKEGHEDVVEHGSATFRIRGDDAPLWWPYHERYLQVSRPTRRGILKRFGDFVFMRLRGDWLVSGNMRCWLSMGRRGHIGYLLPTLKALAPSIFAEFVNVEPVPPTPIYYAPLDVPGLSDPPLRVILLGANVPVGLDAWEQMSHGSATFLIEGLSRTATHQLVRHRSGSFSQESQRYVSLEKGGWHPITPPAVAANYEALAVMSDFYAIAEAKYAQLRALGIRAEDARFLLPGAADSRLVITMPLWGWLAFLNQREEKAAQWEIRAAATAVRTQLHALVSTLF